MWFMDFAYYPEAEGVIAQFAFSGTWLLKDYTWTKLLDDTFEPRPYGDLYYFPPLSSLLLVYFDGDDRIQFNRFYYRRHSPPFHRP